MRGLRILVRNIRDSFKSVFRNFSLSLASISCITITLIVVSISIILTYNVNNFTKLVEEDVTIVAFLEKTVDLTKRLEIEMKIKNLNDVESYEFISKSKIAEEMMASSEAFKNAISSWNEEELPLQDTFQVKVSEIEKIGMVAQNIKNIDGVSVVKYGEGMVEQLISIFDGIRKICIGIVIALIIVTAFLIANTIKITIFSRKREIEIMRLVGASNLNIKIPFLFEGLFLGFIGAIIPVGLTIYGYFTLYNNFDGQVFSPFIKLIEPEPFIYLVSGILILIGIIVGMFGSWHAVKKHLKI